jgi:hypothetical protein
VGNSDRVVADIADLGIGVIVAEKLDASSC